MKSRQARDRINKDYLARKLELTYQEKAMLSEEIQAANTKSVSVALSS